MLHKDYDIQTTFYFACWKKFGVKVIPMKQKLNKDK